MSATAPFWHTQSSSCIISSGCSSAGGGCIKLVDVTRSVYVIFRTAGWKEGYDPCSRIGFLCPRKNTPRVTLGHTKAQRSTGGFPWKEIGASRGEMAVTGLEQEQPGAADLATESMSTSRKSMLGARGWAWDGVFKEATKPTGNALMPRRDTEACNQAALRGILKVYSLACTNPAPPHPRLGSFLMQFSPGFWGWIHSRTSLPWFCGLFFFFSSRASIL